MYRMIVCVLSDLTLPLFLGGGSKPWYIIYIIIIIHLMVAKNMTFDELYLFNSNRTKKNFHLEYNLLCLMFALLK